MASFESNGNAEPMLASYTTSESDYAITYNDGQTHAEEEARSDALQLLLAFGPAFARESRFWKSSCYSLLLGALMGFVALAFFNGFNYMFETWTDWTFSSTTPYSHKLESGLHLNTGDGEWWWLLVTISGGALVGLIRCLPSFPSHVDGLFREVRDLHVDPSHAPLVFVTSCLSLGLGASVGPEAAMGNAGGAIGSLIGNMRDQSDRRKAISAFCGMAGAMGALFPSPMLAVLLMHELSVTSRPGDSRFNAAVTAPIESFVDGATDPSLAQHDFMEQVTLGGIAATAGYAVFYGLAEYTYIDPVNRVNHVTPGGYNHTNYDLFDLRGLKDFGLIISVSDYETWHLAAAVPLGIFAGLIGVVGLVLLGVFRKVNVRVRGRLAERGLPPKAIEVIMPTLGGLLFGLIAVAWPLTLGDGALQLPHVIKRAYEGDWIKQVDGGIRAGGSIKAVTTDPTITLGTLWGTLIGKLLSMGICLGFGFVGGQIFPCIYAGVCAGMIVCRVVPGVPVTLAVPCMMSAVPASFAPIPFTLVGLTALVLVMDGSMAAPVFVATFVSFLTNCGMGITQGVLERQNGLSGVMTKMRNNNQHSVVHRGGGNKTMEDVSALQDVSEIIFANEPGESIRYSLGESTFAVGGKEA